MTLVDLADPSPRRDPADGDTAVLALDLETPLDEQTAVRLLAHLLTGGRVEVRLHHPGPMLSTDVALLAVRRHRLAAARDARLEELASVAGAHGDRVRVLLVTHRWTRPHRRRAEVLPLPTPPAGGTAS